MNRVSIKTISELVKRAEYAVRGPIVVQSQELAAKLAKGDKLPFNKIINCNIGNPHSLGQKPLSYTRDVLSMVVNPSLKDGANFPEDLKAKADRYLSAIPGVGAYSESQGIQAVREDVSDFLKRRDGYASDAKDIFLTNGASEGVRICMQTFIREPKDGMRDAILAPIPQYPLYSALATLLQGSLEPYYLDEAGGWSCTKADLEKAVREAEKKNVRIRGLVVINPGNPTGQVLNEKNMKEIVSFCNEQGICLMADEVYQENVYKEGAKFLSFRKVAMDMGFKNETADNTGLQMVSFHSISKGFYGECGLRGGYFEIFNIPTDVKAELYKLCSISLCSNTIGQIATGLMVNPPKQGEPSYAQYVQERDAILSSLKRRAVLLSKGLNQLEGVSCNSIDGAMYAFPTITLPPKLIEEAKTQGKVADTFYCMELLEATGIVLVPGSGFGQKPGTYHFRTTILPPEDKIADVVKLLGDFHGKFLAKYK